MTLGTVSRSSTLVDESALGASVDFLRARMPARPDIALILGSGWGDFAENLSNRVVVSASEVPHYPRSTVAGHKGQLVIGEIASRRVLAFQGRVHFYECHDLSKVLHPIMIAARLGITTLVVTNAAGGINRQLNPGDLMLITDQIDLTLQSLPAPLHLQRRPALYDRMLLATTLRLAREQAIPVKTGVYAAVIGPSYETAAEVEMIHRLGGDAVGMSTVKEVALASQLGLSVLGISCITNQGTGIGTSRLDHDEVTVVANRAKRDFSILLTELISSF